MSLEVVHRVAILLSDIRRVASIACCYIRINLISEVMGKSKISAIYFETYFKPLHHGLLKAQHTLYT